VWPYLIFSSGNTDGSTDCNAYRLYRDFIDVGWINTRIKRFHWNIYDDLGFYYSKTSYKKVIFLEKN